MCIRVLDERSALSNYSERLLRVKMTKLSNHFRLFVSYTVILITRHPISTRFNPKFISFSPKKRDKFKSDIGVDHL